MTRFTAAYLSHLLDEERDVVPAIREACAEDDVVACRRAFLSTVPPEEAAVTQRWLLVAVDRSTLVHLLTGARASLPAPVFDALVALAHDVLPAVERDHLDAALSAA
jgi:hypothetical protein